MHDYHALTLMSSGSLKNSVLYRLDLQAANLSPHVRSSSTIKNASGSTHRILEPCCSLPEWISKDRQTRRICNTHQNGSLFVPCPLLPRDGRM